MPHVRAQCIQAPCTDVQFYQVTEYKNFIVSGVHVFLFPFYFLFLPYSSVSLQFMVIGSAYSVIFCSLCSRFFFFILNFYQIDQLVATSICLHLSCSEFSELL